MIRVRVATPYVGDEVVHVITPDATNHMIEQDMTLIEELYPGAWIISTEVF